MTQFMTSFGDFSTKFLQKNPMMISSKANTTKNQTRKQIYTYTKMNWTQDRIYQHLYHHYPITRTRFQRPPIPMPRHRHLPLAWVNIIIIIIIIIITIVISNIIIIITFNKDIKYQI